MKFRVFKALITIIVLLSFFEVGAVFGWSNGGFSEMPSEPKYGTHDWIAHHALDWLADGEKQFILDNLAAYLYGTELPDNSVAPDGIGDSVKHHVYFFANGSLQDDAAAVRAQEEYDLALAYSISGGVMECVKHLGVMSHYFCDVAAFGHVMASVTDWGNEVHHSDYETHVNSKTTGYDSEFSSYLVFDGVLSNLSAYDATVQVAYDTTFDTNGGLTCKWMDQNYGWDDLTFKNRCGESLDLAVNLLADVLHTFRSQAAVPEFQHTESLILLIAVAGVAVVVHQKIYRKKQLKIQAKNT